jgi:hypothetical protein
VPIVFVNFNQLNDLQSLVYVYKLGFLLTSGNKAGNIQLRGANISLSDGSVIFSDTLENLQLRLREVVKVGKLQLLPMS